MKKKVLLIALCVALTVVAIVAVATRNTEPPPLQPVRKIAILPLQNTNPDEDTDWIGYANSNTLSLKLRPVPGVFVGLRFATQFCMEEPELKGLDPADPVTAVKAGERLDVDLVGIGRYSVDEGTIEFNFQIVDVATGVVVNEVTVARPMEKILDLNDRMADIAVGALNMRVATVDGVLVVEPVRDSSRIELKEQQRRRLHDDGTANLAAYEAFGRGAAAHDRELETYAYIPDEKIEWYTKAIEHDPNYAWT